MFRPMRREQQQLSREDCLAVLERATAGVLGVHGEDGYPYTVPLSYVTEGDRLWFHCAAAGHKVDAIRRDEKVSFCVIDSDEICPEEYTTHYRSVILFGRARILEDEGEKRHALELLLKKYTPRHMEGGYREIEQYIGSVCLVEITAEHMTGKESMAFVRARRAARD